MFNKKTIWKLIATIWLLIAWLLITLATKASPRGNPVDIWRLDFWQLKPITGDYLSVSRGDTLTISWVQEFSTTPLNKQYDWGIGDTTGVHYSITISLTDVIGIVSQDSTRMDAKYIRKVELEPGMWAITLAARDKYGNWSKHSKPFWFRVTGNPPSMPVEIRVWVK